MYSSNAYAKRTVSGYITDKNGNAAANLRVKALDADWPDSDDLMGITMTDSHGYYEIHYEGGHWDSVPHWWTVWRPDIFIRVSMQVDGCCDDGEWDSDRNWVRLSPDSRTKSNHPHRNNLRMDLQLTNYPRDPVEKHTFQRGVDMWSEVDFFFHSSCFGCAPNGDKVEWESWGIGGPPTITTRCWYPPNPKCTHSDYEKIRDLGLHPYPAETVTNALNYFIESDDVDEEAERTLKIVLMEVQQYITDGNIEEAKLTMEMFKHYVEEEIEKGSITQRSGTFLLISADRFIEARK